MGSAELTAFWAGMTAGAFIALGLVGLTVSLALFVVTDAAKKWLRGGG